MSTGSGARDFDFWMGRWRVHNRRLRERLKGCTEWDEFDATSVARPLPGGIGNEDEFHADFQGGFIGMSFRFFDVAARRWAIYWADNRRGVLEPPVYGSFTGNVGHFEGDDVFEGRPIRVRFLWSRVDTGNPRWEQAFSADGGKTWETNWVMDMTRMSTVERVAHLKNYPVIELRRYTIKPGERDRFARYFESYFPEAFEQLGAMVFGQFLERERPTMFTWLRGFHDMDARALVNSAFYYGALWKEHRLTMNDLMVDSDNVLLLQPIDDSAALPVLPAVDPLEDPSGSRGVVVAQIFAVRPGELEAMTQRAAPHFARYRAAGARQAAVLASLAARNNFPQLPVREDGPFLVWLGLLRDDASCATPFRALMEEASQTLVASGLLREKPEVVVLDPTARSRLRWLD